MIIASIALPCRQVAFRPEKDRKVFLLVNNFETFYTLDRENTGEKKEHLSAYGTKRKSDFGQTLSES